jgi:hypothetical protein
MHGQPLPGNLRFEVERFLGGGFVTWPSELEPKHLMVLSSSVTHVIHVPHEMDLAWSRTCRAHEDNAHPLSPSNSDT